MASSTASAPTRQQSRRQGARSQHGTEPALVLIVCVEAKAILHSLHGARGPVAQLTWQPYRLHMKQAQQEERRSRIPCWHELLEH